MYQGLTLEEMAREVQRQAERKDDLVVDTRDLTLLNGSELQIGEAGAYDVADIAHRQIGERLGIPAKFYDRLRQQIPGLLDENVNRLFRHEDGERRMVRTFRALPAEPGVARAFLSDRYRRRDNDELLAHVLPILGEIPDVKVISTGLTDRNFFLKALAPQVEGEVKLGDQVQAGVVIRNSETGHGSLSIQPLVFRLVCLNGMIVAQATRHYHVGRQVEADADLRVFSDETLKLDDAAFFSKVGDTVRAAVDETRFNAILAEMREAATGQHVAKPKEAVERLSKRFTLTDDEGESVLAHLTEGGDLSAYGMLNAVTRASQEATNYDRATELETVGGQVLALAGTKEWAEIAA